MEETVTRISLFLFGKPSWEGLKVEAGELTPQDLRDKAKELKERLERLGDVLEKLENNGWEQLGGLYSLMLSKEISKEEAKAELQRIGVLKNVQFDDEEEGISLGTLATLLKKFPDASNEELAKFVGALYETEEDKKVLVELVKTAKKMISSQWGIKE